MKYFNKCLQSSINKQNLDILENSKGNNLNKSRKHYKYIKL